MNRKFVDEILFFTLIDEKLVNQNALNILIRSLRRYHPDLTLTVLHACDTQALLRYAPELGHQCHFQALNFSARHADPYYVKFMIKQYLSECAVSAQAIVYLDPDHIALGPLPELGPLFQSGTLMTSSEMTQLRHPQILQWMHAQNFPPVDYNTSVILGQKSDWDKALPEWDVYYALLNQMAFRNNEELAFSLAAIQAGLVLQAVDTSVQSNFSNWGSPCSLFHYGGDSELAIQIKACLQTFDQAQNRAQLQALQADCEHAQAKDLIQGLLDNLEATHD